MPKVQVNDIQMYYEIHGKGEPLVLIAGFSVDHVVWYEVVDKFKEHFQVIVFDNRGAGQTDVPKGPYSIEQMADDVAGLLDHLKIKQAHIVGSSMGGFILQSLAYRHKKLVKSAVISNSTYVAHTPFHYYVAAQLELIKAQTPVIAVMKASCCWAFSYQYLSQPGNYDELIRLGLENPYPFTIAGYEAQFAAIHAFDARSWVEQIDVPTLVIGSDQDLIFNESSIKALADKIPGAKYYGFKDCGHIPMLEYPDQFVEVVKDFILLS